jgi:hypothetical protein
VTPKPPPRSLSPFGKRLSVGGKAVTICVAGINQSNTQQSYIIAAADRKISFGGADSAEGVAMKIFGIHPNWTVMFAGPVSPMTAMVDAIMEKTKRVWAMDFRPFSRLCYSIYRSERKLLLENEVLVNYDIETYAEYIALSRSTDPLDRALYTKVKEKIGEVESEWGLLFAGFDKHRQAHLFTIESGKVAYLDKVGFGAIGSGAWRAQVALSSYPFVRVLPLSQAIFGILAAKFSAEAAHGVGEETILTVLEPQMDGSPVFFGHTIDTLRKLSKALPRFPTDADKIISEELNSFERSGFLRRI